MHNSAPFVALCLAGALSAQSGWSTPTNVTELNSTAADTAPHLSFDGLTVHFGSFRSSNWEIWSATRPNLNAPWSTPVQETALGDPVATDSSPFLTVSGLEIWFDSTRGGSMDIMRATRASPTSPWNTPTFVTELNSSATDGGPSLTLDGREVYFLSSGHGAPYAPNFSIFRATRPDLLSPFGPPTVVAELAAVQNARESYRDVEISKDGLRITFCRSVAATGRLEVFVATRTNFSAPFGTPVLISDFSNIAPSGGIYSATFSLDGTEVLLAGGFPAANGSQEILTARFSGLTSLGAPSLIGSAALTLVDPTSAGLTYALALSGGTTGFPLGARQVPIDGDGLFLATFGTNIPLLSTGFLGVLDAAGRAQGQLTNPLAALIGLNVHAGGFVLSPAAPFGVKTITNSVALEFQ